MTKSSIHLLLFAILVVLCFENKAYALNNLVNQPNEQQSIVMHTEQFPPYNYRKNDSVSGINIEIVRALCAKAGIQCEFQLYPWNRAMRMTLNRANTGLVSTALTPERNELFHWVGPLISGTNCIYKLSSRDDISISNNQDLSQYSLGVSTDSIYDEVLAELGFDVNKNLIVYQGKFGKLKPFVAGRIDLIIGSATSIATQLEYIDLDVSFVNPVAIIEHKSLTGNYLALNKSTDPQIIEKLQTAYAALQATDEIENINQKFEKESNLSKPQDVDSKLWDLCMSVYK